MSSSLLLLLDIGFKRIKNIDAAESKPEEQHGSHEKTPGSSGETRFKVRSIGKI